MNGLTSISLKDGTVLSFYTDYNEYSQIDRAYHTVTVAYQTVMTPYYGYGYYPQAYPIMPQPVQPQRVRYNHYNVPTPPQFINHGYNNSRVHQGSHTSYAVSGMPMAAAAPTYSAGNYSRHHGGCSGGAMMARPTASYGGLPMGG